MPIPVTRGNLNMSISKTCVIINEREPVNLRCFGSTYVSNPCKSMIKYYVHNFKNTSIAKLCVVVLE